jgi:TldD protein
MKFKTLTFTLRTLLLTFILLPTLLMAQSASSSSIDNDPLMSSLKTELDRSRQRLQLDNEKKPYFVQYTVTDVQSLTGEAVFGAIRRENQTHIRFLRAEVRVGDYKRDSSFGNGDGVSDLVPLDDDPIAIRHQIWLATDTAYKRALEVLTEKEARLKQIEVEYQVDDFAKSSPVVSISPVLKLEYGGEEGRKRYRTMMESASALYRSDAKIQTFSASYDFTVTNMYLLNSEGSMVRNGRENYSFSISASTQAPDGMRLDRGRSFAAAKIGELLDGTKFNGEAEKIIASLATLRSAPIVEDQYQGPVLFSPDAAADVFHDLVGNNALGRKPNLGSPARTGTEYANYYHSRVLPEFINIVDDPSMTTFKGKTLLGHYDVDEEGVKAQTVNIIDKGKLTSYLLGRSPIRDFPESNGHGRSSTGGSPGPAMSNLVVKASETLSRADLEKKLIEMCKDRGLAFGYFVQTLGGISSPRLLYKVYVKDGHRELVRGARFGDLDRRTLRSDLAAAGDDAELDNRANGVPISIITPSILIDEMEVRRDNTTKEKLPQYGPPPLGTATSSKTGN